MAHEVIERSALLFSLSPSLIIFHLSNCHLLCAPSTSAAAAAWLGFQSVSLVPFAVLQQLPNVAAPYLLYGNLAGTIPPSARSILNYFPSHHRHQPASLPQTTQPWVPCIEDDGRAGYGSATSLGIILLVAVGAMVLNGARCALHINYAR